MALRGGERITPPTALVVIGTPEDRRITLLQAALAGRGYPPATLISYQQVLAGEVEWQQVVPSGAVVRIESPGKSIATQSLLIQAGGGSAVPLLEGEWRDTTAWYRGFCFALDQISAGVAGIEGVRWMNPPADIALMFDKVACHAHLQAHGIPVAPSIPDITSFYDLIPAMRQRNINQVFIKSPYGSSAAGMMALRVRSESLSAVTTLERGFHHGDFHIFNTRHLRHLTDPLEIQEWADCLLTEGAHVERWIPKAGWQGKTFDLRMVVIGGKVRHQVMRLSNSPMTNLHLLNQRSDTKALAEHIGATAWEGLLQTCEQVMATFPTTLYAGIDVALTAHTYKPVVLEVNAFGDLLTDVVDGGKDTYSAELTQCGWV
jgi:hypothetical protein